jgi:hypothetical protein
MILTFLSKLFAAALPTLLAQFAQMRTKFEVVQIDRLKEG